MDQNKILTDFYQAFQKRDFATMQSCYHKEAQFSDPAFQNLNVQQVKAMWHMLCERGKDLEIVFEVLDDSRVFWEANYSFSKSGRQVENKITASFIFKEGLIIKHTDDFDLWKWAGMAIGPVGSFLGWTPFMKTKIRKMAMSNLKQFISKHPEYK